MSGIITTAEDLDAALNSTVAASRVLAELDPAERAGLLRAIGAAIAEAKDDLVSIATEETGLGAERLAGEVVRTVTQFRLYADAVEEGSWLGASITHAVPTNTPPIDDHRRVNVAIGPVIVFAASNFPFAFGVAGTDTASALAAGCAVVAKGHPGHPRLAARLGEIMSSAIAEAGAPAGTVTLVGPELAVSVLRDDRIDAGAFTGSIAGGRALLGIAQERDRPIPFFAEMGSVNPVVVTPAAWAARREEILDGLFASMSLSNGQLCTSPGVLLVAGKIELADLSARLTGATTAPMLTDSIAAGFRAGVEKLASTAGVAPAGPLLLGERAAGPIMWLSDRDALRASPDILDERFGPSTVAIECRDTSEMLEVVNGLDGQLTASIFSEPADDIAQLVAALSRRAGRVLHNAWPTGVAVSWSMHHGGPWPAASSPLHGSVGTEAINRFVRPVAYQNFPDSILPAALQESNPWRLPRRVDGVLIPTAGT